MTSGQLSAHGRHGGHEPLSLPRGERPGPAAGIDASRSHQPPGCRPADARQRSQQRLRAHPACRLVVPRQGLF